MFHYKLAMNFSYDSQGTEISCKSLPQSTVKVIFTIAT